MRGGGGHRRRRLGPREKQPCDVLARPGQNSHTRESRIYLPSRPSVRPIPSLLLSIYFVLLLLHRYTVHNSFTSLFSLSSLLSSFSRPLFFYSWRLPPFCFLICSLCVCVNQFLPFLRLRGQSPLYSFFQKEPQPKRKGHTHTQSTS